MDREYQEEIEREQESGDAGGMGVRTEDVEGKLRFLVVYVWEAEDLPQMGALGTSLQVVLKRMSGASSVASMPELVPCLSRAKVNLAPEFGRSCGYQLRSLQMLPQ